jgi:hypothetical protein
MKVFRQIKIDNKQRHREGENAVGQGTETNSAASVLARFLFEPRAVGPEKVL